jgi:hypothetical protein
VIEFARNFRDFISFIKRIMDLKTRSKRPSGVFYKKILQIYIKNTLMAAWIKNSKNLLERK